MVCSVLDCSKMVCAHGLCRKHYMQLPEIKEHKKEYCSRPEIKEHRKEYYKENCSRPEIKNRVNFSVLVSDFFKHFNNNKAWQKEGIEVMSQVYSEQACDLTRKQQCDLQEKILKELKKNEF